MNAMETRNTLLHMLTLIPCLEQVLTNLLMKTSKTLPYLFFFFFFFSFTQQIMYKIVLSVPQI